MASAGARGEQPYRRRGWHSHEAAVLGVVALLLGVASGKRDPDYPDF